MATQKNIRHAFKEGPAAVRSRWLHFDDSHDGMRLPATLLAHLFEKNIAQVIGGGLNPNLSTTLVVPGFTVTAGGTGDATGYSTTGGLLITCPSDDDFNVDLRSVLTVTPTAGKWYGMLARIAVSNATGIGFRLGLATAQPLPFTTDYTDFVGISKAITSASVFGRVRGDSGTAAQASLGTLSTAEVEVGYMAYLHATTPAGWFSYKTAAAEWPTFTPFTAAQLTQLAAILTTPQTMYHTIHATGVTGTNPTLTVTSFIAGGDR